MNQEFYQELIIKLLACEISDDELHLLKGWLEQNSTNRRLFDEINELWQESGINENSCSLNTDIGWSRVNKQLDFDKKLDNKVVTLKKSRYRVLLAAASIACLIAVAGLTLLGIIENRTAKYIKITSTTITTRDGEKAQISLADSTKIELNSGSKLIYPTDYNLKQRKIKFSGEAYFNVQTNPQKPFVVEMDKMKVYATGTQFNILNHDNENRIETTLENGSIKVDIPGQKLIDVKVGQQVVYHPNSGEVELKDVTTETYTSWRENKLRFIDTPSEEVFRRLARRYNVTFKITDRKILDLKYTATFIDESIDDVMKMLNTVSPIMYKINNRTDINDAKYEKPEIVVGLGSK